MWDQVTQIETCGTKGPSQNNKRPQWRVKNRQGAQVHFFYENKIYFIVLAHTDIVG